MRIASSRGVSAFSGRVAGPGGLLDRVDDLLRLVLHDHVEEDRVTGPEKEIPDELPRLIRLRGAAVRNRDDSAFHGRRSMFLVFLRDRHGIDAEGRPAWV